MLTISATMARERRGKTELALSGWEMEGEIEGERALGLGVGVGVGEGAMGTGRSLKVHFRVFPQRGKRSQVCCAQVAA